MSFRPLCQSMPFCIKSQLYVVLVLALISPIAVLFINIDAGYELGDHGFYLLHIRQPEELTHTLTHFGYVWLSFFGENSIRINRILNITLIIVMGALLAHILHSMTENTTSAWEKIRFSLVGSGAFVTYFASFIVDPSYNSLTLVLSALIIILIAILLRAAMLRKTSLLYISAALIGFFCSALALTKITSGLVIGLFGLICVLVIVMREKSSVSLLLAIFIGFAGAGLFFLWLPARGVPLEHLLQSFYNGYVAYSSSGGLSIDLILLGVIERLYWYIRLSIGAVLRAGWIFVLPAFAFTVALFLDKRKNGRNMPAHKIFESARLLLIIVLLLAPIFMMIGQLNFVRIQAAMITIFNLGVLISISIFIADRRNFHYSFALVCVGALLLPFFASLGTTNQYFNQVFFLGAGLSFVPAFILSDSIREVGWRDLQLLVLTLLSSIVILTAYIMHQYPYRMGGSLGDAAIEVSFASEEKLRVTPPIADFLQELRPHIFDGDYGERPVVFDLSEQLPFAITFLNGRPPGAAWFLGKMNGEFSARVFDSLSDREVLNGWVLVKDLTASELSQMAHYRSFLERLSRIGVGFEEHYVEVTRLSAPNWGDSAMRIDLILFKPAATGEALRPNFHSR